jgi:hypothetical protein
MTTSRTRATRALTPSARNVLRIFRDATPAEVADGRAWYRRAHDVCRAMADRYGTDVGTAAAVIAVISPAMPWARNVQLAEKAFRLAAEGASFDDIVSGLGMMRANARKAAAIVLGADPASVVSGPKVVPFWQRIVDAASGATGPGSVVVDRHAVDIALGRMTDDATRGTVLGRKGGRHTFAMCYVRAAAALNRSGEAATSGGPITPAEVQAVTWIVWRARHGHAQARAESRRDVARADRGGQ